MPLQESARTEALATHGTQIPWVFIIIICLPLVPIIVLVLFEFLTAKFALKFMAVRRLVNIAFKSWFLLCYLCVFLDDPSLDLLMQIVCHTSHMGKRHFQLFSPSGLSDKPQNQTECDLPTYQSYNVSSHNSHKQI